MKRYLFLSFLLLPGFITFGQTKTVKPKVVVGVSTAAIFSSYEYHGISPALTVNFGNHQLSLGGRIPFFGSGRMSKLNDEQTILVTDFQYRYRLMPRWTKVRPFAFLSAEYGFDRHRNDRFYDHTQQYTYGPIFDHSFAYSSYFRRSELNLYAGLGIEATIWKGLYCFLNAGAGSGYGTGEQRWVETDSGNTVYSAKLNPQPNVNWIASGGIGFRFQPKQALPGSDGN